MAWPVTRANGFVLNAATWNELVAAFSAWGGDVNAGTNDLGNLGVLTFAASGYLAGGAGVGAAGLGSCALRIYSGLDAALSIGNPSATKALAFAYGVGGLNTVEGGLVISKRNATNNDHEGVFFYMDAGTGYAVFGLNAVRPMAPMTVQGSNVYSSGYGTMIVCNGNADTTNTYRLDMGNHASWDGSWIQSSKTNIGLRTLYLNPSGGAVQVGGSGVPGGLVIASALTQATNDSQAASAGIPVGGVYRNGSVLMIRVA